MPSTTWSLVKGRDPLGPARAAGTVLPGRWGRPSLGTGLIVHAAVSAGWVVALAGLARRRGLSVASSAAAGLAIAALDLRVAQWRFPAIAALEQAPQWLDHVAFGVVAGWCLRDLGPAGPARDRRAPTASPASR